MHTAPTPVTIELHEDQPHKLIAHAPRPVNCPNHDAKVAAVLSIDLVAAYACGDSKAGTTSKLAVAAQMLVDDPAFWRDVEAHVRRAWKYAQECKAC